MVTLFTVDNPVKSSLLQSILLGELGNIDNVDDVAVRVTKVCFAGIYHWLAIVKLGTNLRVGDGPAEVIAIIPSEDCFNAITIESVLPGKLVYINEAMGLTLRIDKIAVCLSFTLAPGCIGRRRSALDVKEVPPFSGINPELFDGIEVFGVIYFLYYFELKGFSAILIIGFL